MASLISKIIVAWWQRFRFHKALGKGDTGLAKKILNKTQKAENRYSPLQKTFKEKLELEERLVVSESEVLSLRQQLIEARQNQEIVTIIHKQEYHDLLEQVSTSERTIKNLQHQLNHREKKISLVELQIQSDEYLIKDLEQQIDQKEAALNLSYEQIVIQEQLLKELQQQQSTYNTCLLKPKLELIAHISNVLKITDLDQYKLHCTGIDQIVFDEFESSLTNYLVEEFKKIPELHLTTAINKARTDISEVRNRRDPQYNLELTPHVYFLQYFLDNVYCTYIAWFLIYKSGLLSSQLTVLDIAAGPSTVAYGLALFLQSSKNFLQTSQVPFCYYSLEKQSSLQQHGRQFWQQYVEQHLDTNTYFRFDTSDILSYEKLNKLPQNFFNFIVICHCFFNEKVQRYKALKAYKKIISTSLASEGYILLIVQGTKLYRAYDTYHCEDISKEQQVIKLFLDELQLTLEWYKYITSTGKRGYTENFSEFARENLPNQKFMQPLHNQYLKIPYFKNYAVDDYVILAKKV
ncbi:photosystem II assembly protein [Gloeocapsopsis sp. IPPAS B-1203]|uniref:photosystem II assembly protein n=1 Tax=Gloeocapsopsis sp. IPPAS B-1203 TaxID=2049454 RepID=UPI000C1954AF|nr:photosystem II assembly protein [Gloeocapsopsis sp. IPPAS B-1203]PIG93837.1 photosystem II assembly protein [Gloeocapsopsis sp. IPPAS B-1203]